MQYANVYMYIRGAWQITASTMNGLRSGRLLMSTREVIRNVCFVLALAVCVLAVCAARLALVLPYRL